MASLEDFVASVANLTPHAITFVAKGGATHTFPSAGNLRMREAKAHVIPNEHFLVETSPVFMWDPANEEIVAKLPDAVKNIIVSMPVGLFLAENPAILPGFAVLGPMTGPGKCDRDEKGQIARVHGFIQYARE